MAVKKFFWKIWLLLNNLTKDDAADSIAEVSTANQTARNEDIAKQIVSDRSEYRYDTILNILSLRDEVVRNFIRSGRSVQDGNVNMAPRVKGKWYGQKPTPDYTVHKASADLTLTNTMRAALEEVGFEVLGPKDNVAVINLVTDILTDATDGSITPNEDIRITGDKIKVTDTAAGDPNTGIWFFDESGTRHKVERKLTENMPGTIIARVPALSAGSYTLEIVTAFSGNRKPLNVARTITYYLPLTVK